MRLVPGSFGWCQVLYLLLVNAMILVISAKYLLMINDRILVDGTKYLHLVNAMILVVGAFMHADG